MIHSRPNLSLGAAKKRLKRWLWAVTGQKPEIFCGEAPLYRHRPRGGLYRLYMCALCATVRHKCHSRGGL